MFQLIYRLKRLFYTYLAYFLSKNSKVLSCTVNGFSKFDSNTEFGVNNHFNGCRKFGIGKVIFGDNLHAAKGLRILTSYHNYSGQKIPYDETVIVKNVTIGDNVWIGLDVIILGGVTIGEGVIIQAGSVVSKSLPPFAIAGGNPAVAFKFRDVEHYEKLKALGKVM